MLRKIDMFRRAVGNKNFACKLSQVLFLCGLTIAFILTSISFFAVPSTPRLTLDDAFTSTDTTSYVAVGEIWDNSYFDKNNLDTLLKYVSGNNDVSTTNLYPLTSNTNITELKGLTAESMRASTAGGKTAGKDIVVKFAGFDFTPTYLSKDKSGNLILTLWLANSFQLKGKIYDVESDSDFGGDYYHYDGYSVSYWQDLGIEQPSFLFDKYPNNLYGTSYMNTVVLNNGGYRGRYDDDVFYVKQYNNHAFAPFTTNTTITKYIVTPRQITWQEYGQDKRLDDDSYTLSNENWAKDIPVEGTINTDPTKTNYHFRTGLDDGWPYDVNYASKQYSDQWADSTLWLPSLSETGCNDKKIGIWSTSTAQRLDESTETWLRTACDGNIYSYDAETKEEYYYNAVYVLSKLEKTVDLDYMCVGNYGTDFYKSAAVRPALHLNLTLAAKNAAPLLDERVSTDPTSPDGIYKVDKGSGVVDFHITSPKGLEYLSSYSKEGLEGAFNKNWNYILDVDLDMSGYSYTYRLGSTASKIAGTFDGNGHTISNTNRLFEEAENLTVQNLKLRNCDTLFYGVSGEILVKNLMMYGQCSDSSIMFYSIASYSNVKVQNVQLLPTNDIGFLLGYSGGLRVTLTYTDLFVVAPKCSYDTYSISSVTLENSSIHIMDVGYNFRFKYSITLKNTSFYCHGSGGVAHSYEINATDSVIFSDNKVNINTKKLTATGFYTSGSDGVKVYDTNFTNSLWCQADGLAGGLPQLKQHLAGGSEVSQLNSSFNMQSWAAKQPVAT